MPATRRTWLAACIGNLLTQAAPLQAGETGPASAASSPATQARPPAIVARSADGRWHARAEAGALIIEDQQGSNPTRRLPLRALDGRGPGHVTTLLHAPQRRSFIASLDLVPGPPELWEISHDEGAEPIFDGLVHDYKLGEGIALAGFLNPRRTRLDASLRHVVPGPGGAWLLARAPDKPDGRAVLQIWQLDIRRRIGERLVEGDPDLSAARTHEVDGRAVVTVPDRRGGPALTIDWRRP